MAHRGFIEEVPGNLKRTLLGAFDFDAYGVLRLLPGIAVTVQLATASDSDVPHRLGLRCKATGAARCKPPTSLACTCPVCSPSARLEPDGMVGIARAGCHRHCGLER